MNEIIIQADCVESDVFRVRIADFSEITVKHMVMSINSHFAHINIRVRIHCGICLAMSIQQLYRIRKSLKKIDKILIGML